MIIKTTLDRTFEYLSTDPELLYLLGIGPLDNKKARILVTKQPGVLADKFKRLVIWEDKPEALNKLVNAHYLHVDVLVPLHEQGVTGIALTILGAINRVLKGKPIGRGLRSLPPLPDQSIGHGWYKATARFTYNSFNQ